MKVEVLKMDSLRRLGHLLISGPLKRYELEINNIEAVHQSPALDLCKIEISRPWFDPRDHLVLVYGTAEELAETFRTKGVQLTQVTEKNDIIGNIYINPKRVKGVVPITDPSGIIGSKIQFRGPDFIPLPINPVKVRSLLASTSPKPI